MNKDVLYIAPEDDIASVITKLKATKEKIVAIVPPDQPTIFKSIINIKLLTKSATAAGKTIVLVTTDAGIINLAGAARIPVTRDLNSAPAIPSAPDTVSASAVESALTKEPALAGEPSALPVEALTASDTTKTSLKENAPASHGTSIDEKAEADAASLASENADLGAEPSSEKTTSKTAEKPAETSGTQSGQTNESDLKSPQKPTSKAKAWFLKYKIPVLAGGISSIVLILILLWAFLIAPAVKITVTVRTVANNFSESITFTEKLEEEDSATGKFYLEERKIETPTKLEFTATGSKNLGEKATGSLVVQKYFATPGEITVPAGTIFTAQSHNFLTKAAVTLRWEENNFSACVNKPKLSDLISHKDSCLIVASVDVTAAEAGTSFNIAPDKNWSTNAGVGAYSKEAMSGGTDQLITVVQQSDLDAAYRALAGGSTTDSKAKLMSEAPDDRVLIETSFKEGLAEFKTSPALGEEVKEGVVPAATAIMSSSIYAIDKTKLKEFITEKAKLAKDQKIYAIKDPFVENFLKSDNGYAGKLKTAYTTGPKVTEEDIMAKSRGKKIGEVQSVLKSINGVSSVNIEKSFFWVNSVPDDPNKVTTALKVEEK